MLKVADATAIAMAATAPNTGTITEMSVEAVLAPTSKANLSGGNFGENC
ncbi:MAG TPA: hypothetical protein VF303_03800 [Candidatus Nanoarchaeia archaeon]